MVPPQVHVLRHRFPHTWHLLGSYLFDQEASLDGMLEGYVKAVDETRVRAALSEIDALLGDSVSDDAVTEFVDAGDYVDGSGKETLREIAAVLRSLL